jgi:proteasome lid subunit RPN8/RPN11
MGTEVTEKSKEEFIEECWFIYGVKVMGFFIGYPVYHSAGTSGFVEFDWKKAMNPFLIGWFHTHPDGFGPHPSDTDNSTMRGWVRGKAKSMVCGIACEGEEGWYEYYRDLDGTINRRDIKIYLLGETWKNLSMRN